jgi:hypothetical protein
MSKTPPWLTDEQYISKLEVFMAEVARELKSLPSYADPSPEGDNAHIMRKLKALVADAQSARSLALIADERKRQQESEGFMPEHDDQRIRFELSRAAATYCMAAYIRGSAPNATHDEICRIMGDGLWPWEQSWFKTNGDAIRMLVKAGALIAAEIERLQRLET